MHVLFIGGTGLISTAIARQLLQSGHQVTLFNRGKSESRLPEGAAVIHGDRKDFAAFEQTFSDKSFDVVVDMVAFAPEESASAIRAFRGRTAQFIHCSTVCVYSGPVNQLPTTETEPFHSIGSYGQKKIECEKLLMQEHESSAFPVTIMRPSHSYGEGGPLIRSFGPANTLIPRLRQSKPMIVQGDGNSLWAACHVEDVARGFIATMGNNQCIGQAYNITGEEWMTWNTYHQQVAEVVDGTFDPVHIPTDVLQRMEPDWAGSTKDILCWPSIFDMAKLKRDTDYSGQTISWKEGVKRTVEWLGSTGGLDETDQVRQNLEREDELIAAWHNQVVELSASHH